MPAVKDLLKLVPWHQLREGIPSAWHGDLQFDNVIVPEGLSQPFVLIDWRHSFAGLLEVGDRYYDFAKLLGGMIVPYYLIKRNLFSWQQRGEKVTFDLHQTYALNEARSEFMSYLNDHGYDVRRVRLLTALIFLNMAPLHTAPLRHLLRSLGALELARVTSAGQDLAMSVRRTRGTYLPV